MNQSRRALRDASPEVYFIASAISLYFGAAIAVKLFDHMAPGAVALTRVLSASVMIVVWRRSWRRSFSKAELVAAASFGIVLAAMNLSFYLAADRIDLGAGVAIEFIGPVAVAALGTRTRRNTVALLLVVAGIILLSSSTTGTERAGVAFALLAGVLWAGYIVLGTRVAVGGGAIDGLGIGLVFGAVAIAPFGLGGFGPVIDRPWLLAAGLAVGFLSAVVPYGLDQIVMADLPPERFALLLALLPATAAIIGVVMLGQVPSGLGTVGIALVVGAVALRDRSGERRPVN